MKFFIYLFCCFLLGACTTNTTEPSGNSYNEPNIVPVVNATKSSSSIISSSDDSNDSALWISKFISIPEQEFLVETNWIVVKTFSILETEVTQLMFADIMDTLPPQKELKEDYPVASISWYDAVLFCNALSKKLNLDTAYEYTSIGPKNTLLNLVFNENKKSIRLPRNIEWDVAIRAGTQTDYFWGSGNAADYAHYGSTAGVIEVGLKKTNAYGLYDMAGNVHEWVYDWEGPYGTTVGSKRLFRGGSWNSSLVQLKSNYEGSALPDESADTRGFRVVLSNGDVE